ncbi:protein-export chaperone SecB [Paracoccaceae bacterium]|nr:protein-export chaperone SecB [Paracoccaceae bacterium]
MSIKKISQSDLENYVENLLFNHEIELISQFVKDMSFEKKDEFAYFTDEDFRGKTDISLNIDVEHKPRNDNQIVVSLDINLEARINAKTAFLLEMCYCGVFKLPSVWDDLLEKQIKVECPKILFPYVRRIISQTMIESGLPNIDIKNINFFNMYKANS